MKHILSIEQFLKPDIESIFYRADAIENKGLFRENKPLQGKIITNLFYEPSSRTSSSFQAAAYKLGAQVISVNEVKYSSVTKGESLRDTVRTFECYSDAIVLRHPIEGSAQIAADSVNIPVINAGDGAGQHPTQSLLDLWTIAKEQGTIDGLTITMMGDLKYGRTVHSLTKLLRMYKVQINFVAPDNLQIPEQYVEDRDNITDKLASVIKNTDVLYMTRIQKERMHPSELEHLSNYSINETDLQNSKKTLTIMHPLPRNEEIPESIDSDPRAAYFRQMKNGLFLRMALLSSIL